MNNNIIKSLRRTLLNTVAAAVVSIGFTACADEIFETQNSTAPANTYKVSIPASIGGGDTRAIAYNSQTGGYDATFEISDLVFVYDVTKDAGGVKKNEYGYWNPTFLYPDANGKKANLAGELAFATWNQQSWSYVEEITPEVGDELMLLYNSGEKDLYYNRDFTGNHYTNKSGDYAIANVQITSIKDGVITTGPSSFQNPQSIYKINFTGIGSGVKVKRVMINSGKNKIVSNYYPTRKNYPEDFTDVIYIYDEKATDQHELTFMLRFSDDPNRYNQDHPSTPGDVITFMALGSDDHYYIGTKSVSSDLENGKYYHADVAMTDGGLAMKVTNITTGVTLEYPALYTKDADYKAENNGYGSCIEWYGGNDYNHTLTIKDLNMNNGRDGAIAVKTDYDDPNNTKLHKLVLDGVNTLSVTGDHTSITVQNNCSLIISSTSTGTGKLILKAENGHALNVWDNGQLTIESGEVTVDGSLGIGDNSSCIITNSGKLRVLTQKLYSASGIKAASGYVLQTAKEDDYTVYTLKAADPYEQPKALSSATSADLGKIIGSDGNIHVLNWDLPNGISPVAMIASISSEGHGLAVAMDNVKKTNEWGTPMEYFTWDNSGEYNQSKTAEEIFNDWVNNNSVTFGTWYIPTKANLQTMIVDCGIEGDATSAHEDDYSMISNGFSAKLTEAGIFRSNDFRCWTKTGFMYIAKGEGTANAVFEQSQNASTCIHPVLKFPAD